MTIKEFFENNDNARLENGDKWLIHDLDSWVVYWRKKYWKRTRILYKSEHLEEALTVLSENN